MYFSIKLVWKLRNFFFCGFIYIFKKNIKSMCYSCGKIYVGIFVIMCVGYFYCILRNKMDMYNIINIY